MQFKFPSRLYILLFCLLTRLHTVINMLLQLLAVFVSLLISIQGNTTIVIYVDPDNGTTDTDCWAGGMNLPCKDYDLAKKGVLHLKTKYYYDVQVKPYYKTTTCKHVWMYAELNGTCHCGRTIYHSVRCKNNSVSILTCNCMTYGNDSGVIVGKCPYGCGFESTSGLHQYHPLPLDVSKINNAMCGRLNRDGRLCGKCTEGFYPLAYSYDLYCIKCSSIKYNWLKFITVAFLPLTIFYIIVIVFRINATNPYLYGFITINQALGTPVNLRAVLSVTKGKYRFIIRLMAMSYSVWNLDYFRSLPLNICLSLSTLQTLALDYAIAVYPLILIAITYLLIELHARGCRIVLCLWSPFHRCCVRFTRIMDIQSSIIKAFATFLLLTHVKLLNSTMDMLLPVITYNVHGEVAGIYVYYDASYRYFGKEHLPYAIMAIVFFLLFALSPLLLLLFYQTRCFQKCLNACRLNQHALHVFVDAFQGHYTDGTEQGTRDCRWFAAFYFLGRMIIFYLIFGCSQDVMCYSLTGFALMFSAILMIVLKPYKLRKINAYHASVLLYLAASCFSISALDLAIIKAKWISNEIKIGILTLALLPTLVVMVYVAYCALRKCYKAAKNKLKMSMLVSNNTQEKMNLLSPTLRGYQAINT